MSAALNAAAREKKLRKPATAAIAKAARGHLRRKTSGTIAATINGAASDLRRTPGVSEAMSAAMPMNKRMSAGMLSISFGWRWIQA